VAASRILWSSSPAWSARGRPRRSERSGAPVEVMSCHVLSCPAMSCPAMSCHVMSLNGNHPRRRPRSPGSLIQLVDGGRTVANLSTTSLGESGSSLFVIVIGWFA
jgi:hypothetical protein